MDLRGGRDLLAGSLQSDAAVDVVRDGGRYQPDDDNGEPEAQDEPPPRVVERVEPEVKNCTSTSPNGSPLSHSRNVCHWPAALAAIRPSRIDTLDPTQRRTDGVAVAVAVEALLLDAHRPVPRTQPVRQHGIDRDRGRHEQGEDQEQARLGQRFLVKTLVKSTEANHSRSVHRAVATPYRIASTARTIRVGTIALLRRLVVPRARNGCAGRGMSGSPLRSYITAAAWRTAVVQRFGHALRSCRPHRSRARRRRNRTSRRRRRLGPARPPLRAGADR